MLRPFALIVGVVYTLLGLAGFAATGFSSAITSISGSSLIFHLNIFHNLVHLVIGLTFIAVSQVPDLSIAQGVVIGGGAVYVVAALLGFINKLPILAIHGSLDGDNFLHLASGGLAVIVGLVSIQQSDAERGGATERAPA